MRLPRTRGSGENVTILSRQKLSDFLGAGCGIGLTGVTLRGARLGIPLTVLMYLLGP